MHYGPNCWALIVATLCAYELLPLKMFPTIEKTEFNDKFVKFAIRFLRHFVWEKHFNPLSCLLYFSEIFPYVNHTWYRNIVLSIIFHYPFFFLERPGVGDCRHYAREVKQRNRLQVCQQVRSGFWSMCHISPIFSSLFLSPFSCQHLMGMEQIS